VDRFGDGDAIVRFEQTHRGLPVIGRGADVRVSARGQTTLTIDVASELPSRTTPTVDAAGAAKEAARFSPIGARPDEAHLVVWASRGGPARLAWVVLPAVPEGVALAPRIVVDAETGQVIEARDLVTFATARVYRHNPVSTPVLEDRELALDPTEGLLANDFLVANNCIDRKTIKAVSFFGFNQNIRVCDLEQSAVADENDHFAYEPDDAPGSEGSKSDAYSELSIFYHSAKAYAFFRELQGEPEAQVVVDKPLRLIANLQLPPGVSSGSFATAADPDKPLDPFSNAFFSPKGGGLGSLFNQLYGFDSGALWFGQGPQRDYAYDGDVVYHEFGHAVVDHTLKLGVWTLDARGAIDAPGAMNEALSDYFSSAITGDPRVGEYASQDLMQSPNSVIRDLDNDARCPTSLIGQVHHDSLVFSGPLWQARESLPEGDRRKLDAALYKAMRTNAGSPDLTFGELGALFLATLETDFPAGKVALEKALTERGILPTCERILPFRGAPVTAPKTQIGGFVAPGTPTVGVTGLAPGVVQIEAPLPAGSTHVVVTFGSRSSGGGGGSQFGGETKPYTPVVVAKFGEAITWTRVRGAAKHDGELEVVAADAAGGRAAAELEVPPGATSVFVQIANAGEDDGVYDGIVVTSTGEPTDESPPDVPAVSGPADDTSGCGCVVPGTGSQPLGAGTLALGAAALVASLRRRRRR
jgi:MYXO-CTERM domain-containing protein